MTPNQITVLRVLLAFLAVALFGLPRSLGPWAALGGVALIIAAVALDAFDGYIARRRNLATPLGAQLDILGDRVIENLFFTYFAVVGLISLWVPVLFFVRGAATDFVREVAARQGRSGFGAQSMMETRWGRALVASRWSRGAYGVVKCVCFCVLGLQLALRSPGDAAVLGSIASAMRNAVMFAAEALVVAAVVFCIVRGVPVLWEGRRFFATPPLGAPLGAASR